MNCHEEATAALSGAGPQAAAGAWCAFRIQEGSPGGGCSFRAGALGGGVAILRDAGELKRCSASCEALAAGVEYPEEGAAGLTGMGSCTARGGVGLCPCCLSCAKAQAELGLHVKRTNPSTNSVAASSSHCPTE